MFLAVCCLSVRLFCLSCLHVFEEHPSAEPDAVLESPQEVLVRELDDVDAVQGESGVLPHVLDVAVRLTLTRHAHNQPVGTILQLAVGPISKPLSKLTKDGCYYRTS